MRFFQFLLDFFELLCIIINTTYRGVEQLVARRAHNPEVAGSNPASATKGQSLIFKACRPGISGFFFIRIMIFPINFPYIVHIASFEFMTKAAKF